MWRILDFWGILDFFTQHRPFFIGFFILFFLKNTEVNDSMKYCYETDTCSGRTVAGGTAVMTYTECCDSGGEGWGLYGSGDCLVCQPHDAEKDMFEIGRELAQPSSE